MDISRQRFVNAVFSGDIRALYIHVLGIRMIELVPGEPDREVWAPVNVTGMDAIEAYIYYQTANPCSELFTSLEMDAESISPLSLTQLPLF